MQDAFRTFVENVPFYGFAVMCIDHPVVQGIVGRIEDRRIITYGENPQADARLLIFVRAGGGSRFKVVFRNRKTDATHEIADIQLPMPGRHNVLNATAAIAVAHELGLSDDTIRKAIAGFGGVKRRFTKTGETNGVTVIDDYGHHPVEIAAALRAARNPPVARSSRWCSRIASPGCNRCSRNFAPALMTPTRLWSPKSTLQARRRSQGSIATILCLACARMAIAR